MRKLTDEEVSAEEYEKNIPEQKMRRCLMCGMTALLNEDGYCRSCAEKIKEGYSTGDIPRQTTNTIFERHTKCAVPAWKIINAFNGFYKFFKRGSIVASIVLFLGWLIYLVIGTAEDNARQSIAIQGYANGYTRNLSVQSFNPHWEFLGTIALILIFGIFFAYFSQAIAKIVEKVTDKDF